MYTAVNPVSRSAAVGAAADAAAGYRRFAGTGAPARPRESASAAPFMPAAMPAQSPATLLTTLIERMGGATGSRAKGSYVNLRI